MAELNYLPRTPQVIELKQLIQFLNQNLRNESSWSIEQEYPLAINESNLHNMSIIVDPTSHEIMSHALLKPIICKTPYAIFKVGAIGSVVTAPQFRNKGLSRNNILNCIKKAEEQECDFLILWSDQYEFYKKFGFELAGFEHSFLIDQPLPIVNNQCQFLKPLRLTLKPFLKYTINTQLIP